MTPPVDESAPLLDVRGVDRVFAGTVALDGVRLTVRAGEIHALLGENGAGKSTLIKILAGVHRQDAGEILVAGEALSPDHTPKHAQERGIAFIHQNLGLVEELSVMENIALALGYPRKAGLIDWGGVRSRVDRALAVAGIDVDPDALIKELPIGTQAAVAIARALAADARLLVLDEPTASLAAGEVEALFAVLRKLRQEGMGSIFVSHRIDEIYALCDRVTVFRNGRTVGEKSVAELPQSELVELIVGHEVVNRHSASAVEKGPVRLEVDNLKGSLLGPVSLTVNAGEIVGFTGLSDAGVEELGALLMGRTEMQSGWVKLDGEHFVPRSPLDSLERGIGFVPSDRAVDGLAMSLTMRENLFLNPGVRPKDDAGAEGFAPYIVAGRGERSAAAGIVARYDIRPPEPEREVATLSGGNAQKLLLAGVLSREPKLMVLNEPTTGVDVGAREEIYRMIRSSVEAGAACIIAGSDFDEIALVCDRVFVLWRGYVSGVLESSQLSAPAITAAALQRGEA